MAQGGLFLKKYLSTLILVLMLSTAIMLPKGALAEELDLESHSALLMEQSTGLVVYEKNAHEALPLASVTKVMTLLLAVEAIEAGKVSLDDIVTVSKRAMDMGGTTIFLSQGDQISLENAIIGVAAGSANDASVVVAEHVAGSYEGFVDMMNERARDLGMSNTKFVNPSGLPAEGGSNVSSAYDIALMSRELLQYDMVYKWTTIQWDTNFLDRVYLSNTNMKFLRNYPGADGLKTGWTTEAGHCISATAKREDTRFIAVTMRSPNPDIRLKEVCKLLNIGFGSYKTVPINRKGDIIQTVEIDKGKKTNVDVIAKEDIAILMDRKQEEVVTHRIDLPQKLQAPLSKGQVVGKVEVLKGEEVVKTVDLIVNEDVEKAGPFTLMGRMFRTMLERVR